MKSIHYSIPIVGLTAILIGSDPASFAQPLQSVLKAAARANNPRFEYFFNQGLEKVKRGDYREAIEKFTHAIEIDAQNADA